TRFVEIDLAATAPFHELRVVVSADALEAVGSAVGMPDAVEAGNVGALIFNEIDRSTGGGEIGKPAGDRSACARGVDELDGCSVGLEQVLLKALIDAVDEIQFIDGCDEVIGIRRRAAGEQIREEFRARGRAVAPPDLRSRGLVG